MSEAIHDNARWLIAQLLDRLGQALEGMMGVRPPLQCKPEEPEAAAVAPKLIWEQAFREIPGGTVSVAASEGAWTAIGSQVLRAAGIEDGDAASIRSTFLEITGQAIAGLAQALTARLHREINADAGREAPERPAGTWLAVNVGFEGAETEFLAGFSDGMLEALDGPVQAPVSEEPPQQPPAPEPARLLEAGNPQTLDLLLDVELPVSVSFGRAQLLLKDVLKLTTGSIVELNRTITEPVEVIVNNCVIARGEVVVVEGNFGVRIQQVISRQERLRTLDW